MPRQPTNIAALLPFLLIVASAALSGELSVADRQPTQSDGLVRLGHALFLDTHLSRDGSIACVSCHKPEQAFSDGKPVAEGVGGHNGTRNTPSLRVAAYTQAQFWDGRRTSLEEQVLDPFFNPNEHGLRDENELLAKISEQAAYTRLLADTWGISAQQIRPVHIAQALSAYIRSLKPVNIRLDRYLYAQEFTALNPAERRGLDLFRGRARCGGCHIIGPQQAPLTDGQFHSLAIGFDRLAPKLADLTRRTAPLSRPELNRLISTDADVAALGRYVVSLMPADIGRFKTPSLRNVADTAPYMHDGSVPTLEQAVERELYYRGKDLGRPLVLNLAERADLLAFLRGLAAREAAPGKK